VRYAVLSDVHGNLEALSAVLADAASEGALGILCLGDAVGYGADPGACVEILGERSARMVAGNHEHGALGLVDLRWFNSAARAAALWTRERLGADHESFLSGLPLAATHGEATCVHASPRRPEEWDYLLSADDGFEAFGDFATRLCFVGHSHRPGAHRAIQLDAAEVPFDGMAIAAALAATSGASGSPATAIRGRRTSCGTRTSEASRSGA